MNPYVGACGGGSYPYPMQQMVGQGMPGQQPGQTDANYWQTVVNALPGPYAGPCGPAVFPAGYVAQAGLAGIAANNAPQQPIGLSCGPVAPATTAVVVGVTVLTPGGTCEACCTAQGCFCVTNITVGNCGQCVFLICSIKSGLCELIQCGSILADTFYCNCDHPPLKSSMLMPGIEFCIEVENILVADSTDAAAVAAATRTFYATVWGLPGDNSCTPCIGPDPYLPPPVYQPPGGVFPHPQYTPPGLMGPFTLNPGFLPAVPAPGPL